MLPRIVALLLLPLPLAMADAEIPLWPDGAPGAKGTRLEDVPTITPYLVPHPSAKTPAPARPAIVVCPGGGYGMLSSHEGEGYARWLNQHGINAFVLKYRLGSKGYRHPAMLEDAARAVRTVRARAGEWHVDPARIGIMGSSAGGHLAATLLTHFDAGNPAASDPIEKQSSRPDFGILCYAVITMGPFTHQGSKDNLLGKDPSPELVELLSNEKQVRDDTPPCFIWHTTEDKVVAVENSLLFASALRAHHVPFDLHIYEKGGHGMGLGHRSADSAALHPWTGDLLYWMNECKLLQP
ncbi:MAG TPA: alpha/beta hydrolase [Chthoniobacterales bacterium]